MREGGLIQMEDSLIIGEHLARRNCQTLFEIANTQKIGMVTGLSFEKKITIPVSDTSNYL